MPVDLCKRYVDHSELMKIYRTALFTRIHGILSAGIPLRGLEITPEDCGAWGRLGEMHQEVAKRAGAGTPGATKGNEDAVKAYRKITEYCPDEMYAYNKLG